MTGTWKTTIHRCLKSFSVQPHRHKSIRLSTDPFFVEKIREIDGLYLNPPEKPVVLKVEEKTQIQALDRTQPLLPIGLDHVEGVTHYYIRHGSTTLLAALDVATGTVIAECEPATGTRKSWPFYDASNEVAKELELDLIGDNYCTQK